MPVPDFDRVVQELVAAALFDVNLNRHDLEQSSQASSAVIPVFIRPVSMPDSGILSASDSRLYQRSSSDDLHQWLSPLVARYNDIFTNVRVQSMNRLQAGGMADYERCQRIIFYTTQVCFAITRRQLRRMCPAANMSGTFFDTAMRGSTTIPYQTNTSSSIPLDTQQLTRLFLATTRRLTRRPPPDCACRVTSAAESPYYDSNEPIRGVPLAQIELDALDELIREVCSLAWYLLTEHQAVASRSFASGVAHQNGSLRVWHVDVDRSAKPADKYDPKCRPIHPGNQQCGMSYLSNSMDSNLLASVLSKGEACTRNPLNCVSQQDRAAALLNNECHVTGCPHPINNASTMQPTLKRKKICPFARARRT
ncbi:unnamed protein product [Echinostoma caproni]|uniref:MIEAP domain-containing protein n=1 Tax=Echinostoma caproni TaxID=27848 RepID=A0A183ACZ4_9TREM|nr:unnamed protein product [Echinostoma caproni]